MLDLHVDGHGIFMGYRIGPTSAEVMVGASACPVSTGASVEREAGHDGIVGGSLGEV